MKALFWLAVAFCGLGFAGYVYLIPYQKMLHAVALRQAELANQRAAADEAAAQRDKLKARLDTYVDADKEKADAESKKKATLDALAAGLKGGLEELGATVALDDKGLKISFPAAKVIDKNEIDVSDAGQEVLKLVAGTAKKESAKIRIFAHTSGAAPPKQLRSLFKTAGEIRAVRAARVMSALEAAGLPPGDIMIVGQADRAPARSRGRRGPPAPPDRLDLEVEPG
jgi:flagellar motor protein MotB